MSEFRFDINVEEGTISVYNNGKSIPIVEHKVEKVMVAEMIFGQLLTSSNYDDGQKRTTGGRNGYGAKLANIFSKEFIVETCDHEAGLKYKQVWKDNMFKRYDPVITKHKSSTSYTKITFKPDFERFQMKGLDDDIVQIFTRRVYDVAGTTGKGLKVFLNGQRIHIDNFKQYSDCYFPATMDKNSIVYERIGERWEVIVAPSDSNFQQVSFVNGIFTSKGGTHINAIADQVIKVLIENISKKHKRLVIKPAHVKNHLFIMVNCLIENPSFDTQTKLTLTTKKSAFGSDCTLSDTILKKLSKSAICDNILAFAQVKQEKDMKKNDGKKTAKTVVGIPKLEDANEAGGRRAKDCTLILTEGDSAKALAMAGLSVVGRDLFGVFPLRGKLLNVREATGTQILENKEIGYLKQIIGLKTGVKYTDTSSLRYGHIMIMTDQDHDGSHIKGLIINMFDSFWPELLKIPGFLTEFITPIVKVTKGQKEIPFYTLPQFETWKESTNNGKGWKSKYYKGLGTSTTADAKVYFSNIDTHQIPFEYKDRVDNEKIQLAFAKNAANKRKEWLAQYVPGTYLDHNQGSIVYQDFIDKELILYSVAANQRAIPCIVDGFKPAQRKVIFASFKRNLTQELKVAQLVGYAAEQSAYHHGEASLAGTIVNLAQNYVGSNNINLLWPSGQFGTRASGGKDAASARYIFTYLSPVTRAIFNKKDDAILTYLDDDGVPIEPEYYVPVIPMVLVNGSSGIGMGWSSDIPNYNPRDLIANIRALLKGEELQPLHPWYKGFIGQYVIKGESSYIFRGLVEKVDDTTFYIRELPIQTWTSDYKTMLEQLVIDNLVKEISEYHTDTNVAFSVTLTPEGLKKAEEVGYHKFFKLESSMSTTNMVLFDKDGKLRKYNTANEILTEFFTIRLDYYSKRKEHMIAQLSDELVYIDAKVRFIQGVIKEEIKIRNVKRDVILKQLVAMKFPKSKQYNAKKQEEAQDTNGMEDEEEESDEENDSKVTSKHYDYLLSMQLWSLTWERVQALLAEKKDKEDMLSVLRKQTIQDMYLHDLEEVEAALVAHEEKEKELMAAAERQKLQQTKAAGRKKTKMQDDSDDDWNTSSSRAKKTTSRKKATSSTTSLPDWVVELKDYTPEYVYEEDAPKRKRAGKTLSVKEEESVLAALYGGDDASSFLKSEEPSPTATTTAAATKATGTKKLSKPRVKKEPAAAKKKANWYDDDDDDDDDFISESEEEFFSGIDDTPVAPKKTRKKITLDSDLSDVTPVKPKATTARAKAVKQEEESPLPKPKITKKTNVMDDESDFVASPVKPKARASKKKVVADDDESDFVASPVKPKARASKKKIVADDDESDFAASPVKKETKPRGRKAKAETTPVPDAEPAPAPVAAPIDMSKLTLKERIALKQQQQKQEAGMQSSISSITTSNEQCNIEDITKNLSQKLTITPKKAPAKRKTKTTDLVPTTPASPPTKKTGRKTSANTKAKKISLYDDDEEEDDVEEDEVIKPNTTLAVGRARRATANKKNVYVIDSEDSSEGEGGLFDKYADYSDSD